MTLLDETDTTIGVVRISKAADERSAEYLEADDHSVRLTWNLRLGLASIASNVDLQPLFVTFDFNKRRWDISQRAYVLLKSDDTGRLIAVMRDIDQLHLPMAASEATFVVAPNDWPDGGMEFGGGHDLAGGGVDGSDPNLGWGGSHKSAMRRTSGLGLLGG